MEKDGDIDREIERGREIGNERRREKVGKNRERAVANWGGKVFQYHARRKGN